MAKKPTPEEVTQQLTDHLGKLPGMFGPASGYAFIVGVMIERDPELVSYAIDLHEKSLARRGE